MKGLLIAIVLLATALLSLYRPQTPTEQTAENIQISSMQLLHDESGLQLQADARLRLPRTVQAGLDSGVPLTFVLDLQVVKPQQWWPDKTLLVHKTHYKLTYYELTRHYRVDALEQDTSRNYRSLSAALSGLGRLGRISIELDNEQQLSLSQSGLEAILAMRLLESALPLPLQPIFRSSWSLSSEEYRWPVT